MRHRRTRSNTGRLLWILQLKKMHLLYEKKNCQHWRSSDLRLLTAGGSTRKLWHILSGIMEGQNMSQVDDGVDIAEDFSKFFTNNIDAARIKTSSVPLRDVPVTAKQVINKWASVTSEQIEKLIGSALSRTCQLDPAPTRLVKLYRQLLSPFVAMSPSQRGAVQQNKSIKSSHRCWKKNQSRCQSTKELRSRRRCRIWRFYLNYWRKSLRYNCRFIWMIMTRCRSTNLPIGGIFSNETALIKVYIDVLTWQLTTDKSQPCVYWISRLHSTGLTLNCYYRDLSAISVSKDWHNPGSNHTWLTEPSVKCTLV